MNAQSARYKEAPKSTKRMESYLQLKHSHPPFIAFRENVDATAKKAIDDLYGSFCDW